MINLSNNILSSQAVEAKYSASFDGIDDFIDTGQTFQSTFRGDFTLSLWVKPADGQLTSDLEFFCGSDAGGSGSIIRIRKNTNGDIEFEIQANGNFSDFRTSSIFSDGAQDSWTHILISFKNNGGANLPTCNIHINGSAPVAISSNSSNVTGSDQSALSISNNLLIGKRTQGNNFEGGIDEFAIFSNDLDTNNAAAIYNGGSPLNLTFDQGNYNNSSNLVAYYKMGDGLFDDIKNGAIHNQVNPGLGNNLVVNGDFSISNTYGTTDSPWVRTPSTGTTTVIDNGVATFTDVGDTNAKLTQAVTYTSGSAYKLSATVQLISGAVSREIRVRDTNSTTDGALTDDDKFSITTDKQNVVFYFLANSNSDAVVVDRRSSGTYTFTADDFILRKFNTNPGITSGGVTFSSDTP